MPPLSEKNLHECHTPVSKISSDAPVTNADTDTAKYRGCFYLELRRDSLSPPNLPHAFIPLIVVKDVF